MEVQNKKTLKTAQNATDFAQFEKILTPAMVQRNMINVPREFCVKNDLVSNRTIFLKRKLEGDGKVDPREWQVGFFFGPGESRIRKGWRTFSKENSLKIGDKCIFRLILKDTIVVETHGMAHSLGGKTMYIGGKSQGVANEEKRPSLQQNNVLGGKIVVRSCKRPAFIDTEGLSESNDQTISKNSDEAPRSYLSKRRKLSTSIGKEEEEGAQEKKKTDPNFIYFDQFEKILTRSMNLPRAFCVKNGLVTTCTIFLQRKLEEEGNVVPGKWPVRLRFGPSICRMGKGWRRFSRENRLKIGDRCIFQLISNDTFIVLTIPPESISIKIEDELGYQRASSPAISSTKKQTILERKVPKNNLQCECIIKGYNLKNFISLRKAFCEANGLTREQTIFLKRNIDGKTWSVGFRPRENEGQLSAGWKDFARENNLQEGDKCTFQLMSEGTLQVKIARKCRKRDAVRNNWRNRRQNIVDESEISVTVRQFHLTYNYLSIPMSFCLRNKLTTKREMVLKASDGKVWYVNFFLNGYKEGRLSRADEWGRFARENELKEGDKLFLKVVSEGTMHFRVVKA
ncbi:B3 domain-containing protein REM12 [Rhynchospora pubera]|uniref:B3 domain-containing protein REM12 n=1 Tax=Rhynchospora pubera TaxID=906938 RepID=A0AAV8HG64_9POAL|nr:B3 domain-containing protein REM12 [Rhynchospora pubera]